MAPDVDAYAAAVSNRALSLKCRGGFSSFPTTGTFKYNYTADANILQTPGRYSFNAVTTVIAGQTGKMVARCQVRYPRRTGFGQYTDVRLLTFVGNRDPWNRSIAHNAAIFFSRFDKANKEFPALEALTQVEIKTSQGGYGWTYTIESAPTRGQTNVAIIVSLTGVNPPIHSPPPGSWNGNPSTDEMTLSVPVAAADPAGLWEFYARIDGGVGTLEVDSQGIQSQGSEVNMVCRYDNRFEVGDFIQVISDIIHEYQITGIELVGRQKFMNLTANRVRK